MSRFIATLKRIIPITQGDVIDDFIKLNEEYQDELVMNSFHITHLINDDGTYGEIHGSFWDTSVDFNNWISSKEVRESMLSIEQPRLDFIKDKIEIIRYLDWDDSGITTDFKSISEFVTSNFTLKPKIDFLI
jgi:hypothetical protein